jgi:hypothetical protein
MAFLPPPSIEIPRPPLEAPLHGLLDTAYVPELSESQRERWEAGISFSANPQTCGHVIPWTPFTDDPEDKADPGTNVPFSTFHSVVLTYSTHCHAIPDSDALATNVEAAHDALEVGTGQAVEAIFWGPYTDGILSDLDGNFSLSGSTPLVTGGPGACTGILNPNGTSGSPTAFTPKQALLALTQALGNCALGARGFLHAPVYVAEDWAEQGLIKLSDRDDPTSKLITNVRGDYAVGGSGYTGVGPDGHPLETPADGFDHRTNLHRIIVERTVAIAANETCLFAAYVDVA